MIETKDLELVVSERIEGKLLTNAMQIRDFVAERVKDYSPEKYAGKVKEAKDDRAVLNKAAKELNDRRIELEREFMAPFKEFKDVIGETVKAIQDASSKIGTVITEVEEQERKARRDEIETAYVESEFTLVSLGRLFDHTWLNKSTSTKKWKAELAAKIEKIQSDLASLDSVEDAEEAKAFYLETLDIGQALQHAQVLKDRRDALQSQQNTESVADTQVPEATEPEPITATAEPYVRPAETAPAPQPVKEGMQHTVTLELYGTRDQLAALRRYIDEQGITYRKVENAS
nr:hypothetical protein 15 [Spirochaetaceae bacterium]